MILQIVLTLLKIVPTLDEFTLILRLCLYRDLSLIGEWKLT